MDEARAAGTMDYAGLIALLRRITRPAGTVGTPGGIAQETTTAYTAIPGSETRRRAFLGPATSEAFLTLRQIVMESKGDGQKVLDRAARLATGPPAYVPVAELNAVSGIGSAA